MVVDIHTHNRKTEAKTIEAVGIHPWHAATGNISVIESAAAEADAIVDSVEALRKLLLK